MEEGRLLIISDGGSDGCSTTSLLLNNIDAAKENERNDFWNKAGKSIAAEGSEEGETIDDEVHVRIEVRVRGASEMRDR
eukprot:scaffold14697_cov80-Skeletonema_menzelii.AAC.1